MVGNVDTVDGACRGVSRHLGRVNSGFDANSKQRARLFGSSEL